ncbi:MAG: IclR family transcriptional regulator [Dethiobacter sp.]|jgi:DNA-binding IclR family transcriptional regulator|nr:IclR family transcriptional regulator [Dethiobacter sp.]
MSGFTESSKAEANYKAETNEESDERDGRHIQSVERVLNILEAMAGEGAPITVTELAEKVNLKISTVHRHLTTLVYRGYVDQEDDNKYRLGFKLMEIGNAVLYYSDIRAVARPYLEELMERCNETVNLAILDDIDVVYIDQVESKNLILVKMLARVGNRGPVHCTSSGKALLAFLPPEKMEELVSRLDLAKYTNETITDADNLRKELKRVRDDGYAVDWGEREEHVRCIAAPIFNHEGRAVACVSISGPSTRITTYYMKNELVDYIRETTDKISRKMGYTGQ